MSNESTVKPKIDEKLQAREFWIEVKSFSSECLTVTREQPDRLTYRVAKDVIHVIEAQPALARIAELEAQNHRQVIMISQLADECNSKDVTIAKLKACAEFYSDETEDGLDWNGVNNPAYIQDKGKLARTTLAEVAELEQKVRGRSD